MNNSSSQTTYFTIFAALIILTILTVIVSGMNLGNFSTFTSIFIATLKGSLVLAFFMNLKNEETIFKIMLFVALMTLAVIMILTFSDILFR